MKVQLHQPSAALSSYIDNYMFVDIDWKQLSSISTIWRLIPFGQVSMLFLLGEPHGYSLSGATEEMHNTSQAFMVGQLTQPIWLKFSGHTRLIKIQFKPSGIQQLLPLNMEEFTNIPSVELEAIWGRSVNEAMEMLHEATDDENKIAILDNFFEKKLLPKRDNAAYIDYTVTQLEKFNGNLNIQNLETKLGISSRHLERLFRAKVGLTPKEISKIIRLNSAFSCLEKDPCMSLTSLSYEAGYYDQAHFSKYFKKIAGISPSKLMSRNSSELFVTHGKCFVKNMPLVNA
ncbi:AraC family transcriptional regulator [Aridibaculum aurantiacum]|uniref:AraC family transcriptional regulator n=1 Tax=Aridibaculum aurantiacum TaxID=2810307 RepID=UPI001A95DFC9|nr:helix-turn-helix domain-containing protein [Aridibaculum aurantiacum]